MEHVVEHAAVQGTVPLVGSFVVVQHIVAWWEHTVVEHVAMEEQFVDVGHVLTVEHVPCLGLAELVTHDALEGKTEVEECILLVVGHVLIPEHVAMVAERLC